MYKKWDPGVKKLGVFPVPVLNQSKQMIAKAKSPHTHHNPSSSWSLLAVSVWVFSVPEARSNTHAQIKTFWFLQESLELLPFDTLESCTWLQRRARFSCCQAVCNYLGRMWGTAPVFGSGRKTQYSFIRNRTRLLMGSTEQNVCVGVHASPKFLTTSYLSTSIFYSCHHLPQLMYLSEKNWRVFSWRKISSDICRLMTTPNTKLKPWTLGTLTADHVGTDQKISEKPLTKVIDDFKSVHQNAIHS